jgi:hypothetical protein
MEEAMNRNISNVGAVGISTSVFLGSILYLEAKMVPKKDFKNKIS